MPMYKDQLGKPGEAIAMGLLSLHKEDHNTAIHIQGEVFIKLEDEATGEVIEWSKKNLIVLDAGILIARLLKDNQEPNFGINMLAVGTGATGSLLAPDAPDAKQRRLNNEIARKPFASTTFRTTEGIAVSYPTNIVDYTTVFTASEAVGPWNEMALLSTISSDPGTTNPNPQTFPAYDSTIDLTNYDIEVNYLPFGVMVKAPTAKFTIVWRLTH